MHTEVPDVVLGSTVNTSLHGTGEYHEGAHDYFTEGVELRGEGCVDSGISD